MILSDERATMAVGRAIGEALRAGDVVTLAGPLGAGKTMLAKGVMAGLGFAGDVPSPTFAIALTYDPPEVRLPVVHADLYRIERAEELVELGLDDALIDGALIVEWPDRAGAGAWPDALALSIAPESDARRLTARVPPSWEARWPYR